MKRHSHVLVVLVSVALLYMAFPTLVYANAAEPPGFIVIVSGAPEDLSLVLQFSNGDQLEPIKLKKEKKAWETHYRFFYHMNPAGRKGLQEGLKDATLIAEGGGQNFEVSLPSETFAMYNNLLTLDVKNKSLSVGQAALRVPLLVALRVVLTLLIEGAIFFLFGYRHKRSWLVFLLVNLLTQGGLNAMITGPGIGSYWVIGFVVGEILILIVEMIAFIRLVKEHKKSRAVFYTMTANIASLVLAGLLISHLPV